MTDVIFLYKGRSKVEGKMTDGWEGRDRARGRKNRLYTKCYRRWIWRVLNCCKQQIRRPESFGVWSIVPATCNSLSHLIPSLGTDIFGVWTEIHGTLTTGKKGEFIQMNFLSNTFCCIISNLIAISFQPNRYFIISMKSPLLIVCSCLKLSTKD